MTQTEAARIAKEKFNADAWVRRGGLLGFLDVPTFVIGFKASWWEHLLYLGEVPGETLGTSLLSWEDALARADAHFYERLTSG